MNAGQLATSAENVEDLLGAVLERIARSAADVSALPLRRDDSCAVAVDQPSEESLHVSANDPVLPVGELDRSRVLRPRPMLREKAWSVLPVVADVDCPRVTTCV